MNEDARRDLLLEIGRSPIVAHQVLFKHRHPDATPPFHFEMIEDWHGDQPYVLTMAFRGSAKSTIAEEALTILACFRRFKNGLIIGESENRAVERLRAIKHEIDFNDMLTAIFKIARGDIWTEAKITLNNSVMLQAYGRGQSLRGAKHNDARPDFIFLDDLEDEESVRTKEGRNKTRVWFTSTVMPALEPGGKMRMAATPLHPEALAPTLATKSFWHTRTYPIEFRDDAGDRQAIWPDRFPLKTIDATRAAYVQLGMLNSFAQEFLCEAVDQSTRVFQADMIRVEPRERKPWHPVYCMYDPARTTLKTSATTGLAVWSWIGPKLVVWESYGRKLSPSEIVEDMFRVDDQYSPVALGVEETGLNDWLLQPIRQQMLLRGRILPLRPVHAPKGKFDFIRGLESFFRAGDIVLAADLPDLREQLLGFPNGDIDAPNALAYALRLRPGAPVYEGFSERHIGGERANPSRSPLWLVVNATPGLVTALLTQIERGRLTILADWLVEGQPGETFADVLKEAGLIAGREFSVVAPSRHFSTYDTIGLRAVAKRFPARIRQGGAEKLGREEIRDLVARESRLKPCFEVGLNCKWSLRALTGGYCRSLGSDGMLMDEPDENAYKVLMEGLESFAALFRNASVGEHEEPNYDYTPAGKRFISARAG
jgi:hypothetical protein